MKFVNVGFGNMVCQDRIITVATPDSEPIKRLVRDAKDDGRVIDVSCGRRTRTVIVVDSDHVILSALSIEKISRRLSDEQADDSDDEE